MKLNIEAINELADRIEQCEEVESYAHTRGRVGPAFTMAQIQYNCGAPACLMGHNAVLHGVSCGDFIENNENVGIAVDLGITVKQSEELCQPQHPHADYFVDPDDRGFITKAHAVAVLRNLRDTGEVDWRIGAAEDSAA